MIEFPLSMSRVLDPISMETFLSRYYEREQLVINRDSPTWYEDLASVETLQEILCATQLTADELRVADDSRDIDPEEYLHADETADPVRVHRLFDQGATISLRQMQSKVPSLARLCRSAEQQFSCAFQTNLYFTPPDAQGFKTHHDTHDVFVLQICGSKQWRTYEPVMRLPLPGQRLYWETHPDEPATKTFTLRPGDLFYCPRGVPHDARAGKEASVHVSLGALVNTWAELLLEIVADVALRDAAFRTSLPPRFAINDVEPAELGKMLRDLLARVQVQARPRHVLGVMAERFILERPALLFGQARTLQAAANLTLESRVGGRPGLIYRVSEHRKQITLLYHAREIAFPRFTATSLKFALCSPAFMPRDLPGPLSEGAKIVLVRRLMREGLVVAVPD